MDTFDEKKTILKELIESNLIDLSRFSAMVEGNDITFEQASGVTGSKFVIIKGVKVAVLKPVGPVPPHLENPILNAVEEKLREPEHCEVEVEDSLNRLHPIMSDVLMSSDASLRDGVPLHRMLCREKLSEIVGRDLGVPPTSLVKIPTLKRRRSSFDLCTLHKFVPSTKELRLAEDAGEIKHVDLQSAQNISLLDMRLINYDRHSGNVLVLKKDGQKSKIVPIDHGLVLSRVPRFYLNSFCWESWSNLKKPLTTMSIHYLQNLNWQRDKENVYGELGVIDKDALDTLCLTTGILKYLGQRSDIDTQTPLSLLKKIKEIEPELWEASDELDLLSSVRALTEEKDISVEEYCEQYLDSFCQV
jgi:hypothetical protein